MLFHAFPNGRSWACMFVNALILVSICKTDIVHITWTTFEMIHNALFVYDLRFWLISLENVADFHSTENRLQSDVDFRTKTL